MPSKLKVVVLDNPDDQSMWERLNSERDAICSLLARNGESLIPSQESEKGKKPSFMIDLHQMIWFLGYHGENLIGIATLIPVMTPRKVFGLIEDLLADVDSSKHSAAIRQLILEKVVKHARSTHMSYLRATCHPMHQGTNLLLQTSGFTLAATKFQDGLEGTNLYQIDVN